MNEKATLTINLSDEMRAFIDRQVSVRGYRSGADYIRALVQREQGKERLRRLLLEGMDSPLSVRVADKAYFDELRELVRSSARGKGPDRSSSRRP